MMRYSRLAVALNAVVVATCFASPSGATAGSSKKPVHRETATNNVKKDRPGLGQPRKPNHKLKPSTALAKRSKEAGLIDALRLEFEEFKAALTSPAISEAPAPSKGKSLSRRIFLNRDGRATLHLLGANHGDIFSVNGTWHTIDYAAINALEAASRIDNPGAVFAFEETGVEHASRARAIELQYRFGTAPNPSPDSSYLVPPTGGLQHIWAPANVLTAKQREATAAHQKPGVHLFMPETGFTDVKVKRVGRVRKVTQLKYRGDAVDLEVAAGTNLKILTGFFRDQGAGLDATNTSVEVYFKNDADGQERKVSTIAFDPFYFNVGAVGRALGGKPHEQQPLLLQAPQNGTYTLRLRSPNGPRNAAANIRVRIEQTFEAQSPTQLAAEFRDWKEAGGM